MTKLLIFNPEHDMCLANGGSHYVPPRSAVQRAVQGCNIMQVLYPDGTGATPYQPLPGLHTINAVVPWGWNPTLKQQLLTLGLPPTLLPSNQWLNNLRQLQHRATLLPLQPDCRQLNTVAEACEAAADAPNGLMLKAPWSGAGHGLRAVQHPLSSLDRAWIAKTIRTQGSVVAEPRRQVVYDFAIEYLAAEGKVHPFGLSAFSTAGGVYRSNKELTDSQIEQQIATLATPAALAALRSRVEPWLESHIAATYSGPMGLDLMACADGTLAVAELNLRHTMGMVAHARINHKPLTI